ncbi:hypothetical protein HMPREF9303_2311 [Prevotella denticola CRIS 18C-A]|uniref:Uncharacterized protein n=1 Tax=Prevotella denticola CRIS 18C-A TaxID=944557 RepID=F0H3X2_9BACT|nr:hypothetical protein HMPREF9303_2311 [Prevotella denticola CRIS 18C-A]
MTVAVGQALSPCRLLTHPFRNRFPSLLSRCTGGRAMAFLLSVLAR